MTKGYKIQAEVHVVEKAEMEKLGEKWMKDGRFHEVISFRLEESGPGRGGVWRLGDVVVWEGAKKRDYLVRHGLLHLLGVHHE